MASRSVVPQSTISRSGGRLHRQLSFPSAPTIRRDHAIPSARPLWLAGISDRCSDVEMTSDKIHHPGTCSGQNFLIFSQAFVLDDDALKTQPLHAFFQVESKQWMVDAEAGIVPVRNRTAGSDIQTEHGWRIHAEKIDGRRILYQSGFFIIKSRPLVRGNSEKPR